MRLSRLLTKERITEVIEEALDTIDAELGSVNEVSILTDAVYELVTELDSEEDFGVPEDTEDES